MHDDLFSLKLFMGFLIWPYYWLIILLLFLESCSKVFLYHHEPLITKKNARVVEIQSILFSDFVVERQNVYKIDQKHQNELIECVVLIYTQLTELMQTSCFEYCPKCWKLVTHSLIQIISYLMKEALCVVPRVDSARNTKYPQYYFPFLNFFHQ